MRDGFDSKKGKESTMAAGTITRQTQLRRSGAVQYKVARVVVAMVTLGLLTALWVALWVPSAPIA
jgi:uncharacterized membrane protein YjgN (DUF898 family)